MNISGCLRFRHAEIELVIHQEYMNVQEITQS